MLLFIYYYYYFWLCWVFVSVRGLSLVAASGGHSSSRCAGLSLSQPLLLQSTGSRRAGSVIVAHGPSCSAACGIFPDQGSNPCPLHWQADSQPLRHQGSPHFKYFWVLTLLDYLVVLNWKLRLTLASVTPCSPAFPSLSQCLLQALSLLPEGSSQFSPRYSSLFMLALSPCMLVIPKYTWPTLTALLGSRPKHAPSVSPLDSLIDHTSPAFPNLN